MHQRIDYWLNKLFYDLHGDAALAARFRADRRAVMAGYPLESGVIAAVLHDDLACIAPLSNGFLLRYYCLAARMPEPVFLQHMLAMRAAGPVAVQHG